MAGERQRAGGSARAAARRASEERHAGLLARLKELEAQLEAANGRIAQLEGGGKGGCCSVQ